MAPDPADIQGLVRRPYRYQLSRHLLFRVDDPGQGRRMLAALLPRITTGANDVAGSAEPLVNVGLTWAGLSALGAATGAEAAFPDAFVTPAEVGGWGGRLRASDAHVAVHLHCRTVDALARASAEVRRMAGNGIVELRPVDSEDGILNGKALSGGLMHFDLLDGLSEPPIDWDDTGTDPRTVDMRHVLLGYADDRFPCHPRVEPWATLVRNGTYGVLQVIRQHAAAFERYLDDAAPSLAPGLPVDEARALLKAKMLGRWDDGTPLALSPDGPDENASRTDFGYADDPKGLRCPLHAHIRLANRRDQPLDDLTAPSFPNGGPHLLRRGLPYGERFAGGVVDDGVDRGVVGFFLCADLLRQYLTVQKWMNKADFSPDFDIVRDVHLQDMMMADRSFPGADHRAFIPSMTHDAPPRLTAPRLPPLPSFTTTVGTLFLLLPGLAGLRSIAGQA